MDAWREEFYWLDKSCLYKFRHNESLNQWFLRYWQLANNKFYPKRHKDRLFISFSDSTSCDYIRRKLLNEHIKCICLNDHTMCGNAKYNEFIPLLIEAFETKFHQKSEFEK
jgi:hypothetical protein